MSTRVSPAEDFVRLVRAAGANILRRFTMRFNMRSHSDRDLSEVEHAADLALCSEGCAEGIAHKYREHESEAETVLLGVSMPSTLENVYTALSTIENRLSNLIESHTSGPAAMHGGVASAIGAACLAGDISEDKALEICWDLLAATIR